MKMFSDCSGECCICVCGDGGCLAGHGDDDFSLASKEQIISRLDKGQYQSYTNIMIGILKNKYGYDYKASAEWKIVVDDFDDGLGNRELPHCTNCGRGVYRHDAGSWCPFCGASMKNPMRT